MFPCGGGYGETEPADDQRKQLCAEVKPAAEKITGKSYDVFEAKLYRSQVVEGKNYLIKVHVGGDDYLHLLVHQALPCYGGEITLTKLQQDKKEDDPLVPF